MRCGVELEGKREYESPSAGRLFKFLGAEVECERRGGLLLGLLLRLPPWHVPKSMLSRLLLTLYSSSGRLLTECVDLEMSTIDDATDKTELS
jgi:hypothetical protein